MEVILIFILTLLSLIATLFFFIGSFDKSDDWVWRIWKLIFGIVFTLITIFLTNNAIEEYNSFKKTNTNEYRSYDHDYIYY